MHRGQGSGVRDGGEGGKERRKERERRENERERERKRERLLANDPCFYPNRFPVGSFNW
jgi:hypothetical protein